MRSSDRTGRRCWASLAAIALSLGVVAIGASPVDAHSTLSTASPGPGDEVGGRVDHLDLVFAAGLSDATVTLTGPDGALIAGSTTEVQNNRLRFEVDPLEAEGQYVARYEFESFDGDTTRSAYAFSYRAAAPPPKKIGPVDPFSDPEQIATVSPIKYVGLAAVVVAVLGAAALAWSYRPGRSA